MWQSHRREYLQGTIDVKQLPNTPTLMFERWFNDAKKKAKRKKHLDFDAFVLSTANHHPAIPSSRVVLLKHYDEKGFVFFTNYYSKKGQNIAANPNVAMNFYWAFVERQIHVEGVARKLEKKLSQSYFATRTRKAQIVAWASNQSDVLPNEDTLKKKIADITQKYANQTSIPMPPFWGGFLIEPTSIEFWQGRKHRQHERLLYKKQKTKKIHEYLENRKTISLKKIFIMIFIP